jgi:hypothetical protein
MRCCVSAAASALSAGRVCRVVMGRQHRCAEASMGEVSTIGLDLAKEMFQVYGADAAGAV